MELVSKCVQAGDGGDAVTMPGEPGDGGGCGGWTSAM